MACPWLVTFWSWKMFPPQVVNSPRDEEIRGLPGAFHEEEKEQKISMALPNCNVKTLPFWNLTRTFKLRSRCRWEGCDGNHEGRRPRHRQEHRRVVLACNGFEVIDLFGGLATKFRNCSGKAMRRDWTVRPDYLSSMKLFTLPRKWSYQYQTPF